MEPSNVRIETLDVYATGGRQIGPRPRGSDLLARRGPEIQAAIGEATRLVQASLDETPQRPGWHVDSIEVSFGIAVGAEAGVLLTKATADATLAVKIVVQRADRTGG